MQYHRKSRLVGTYYLKAQQIRRLIADDFIQAFTKCDIITFWTRPSLNALSPIVTRALLYRIIVFVSTLSMLSWMCDMSSLSLAT